MINSSCVYQNNDKKNITTNNIESQINGFKYHFKPTKNLMQNIIKYSEMERFDNHQTQFHDISKEDLYQSKLNTKLHGNKSKNANLTLKEYIDKHSHQDSEGRTWRDKLQQSELKINNMPKENAVKVLTPCELFNKAKNTNCALTNSFNKSGATVSKGNFSHR